MILSENYLREQAQRRNITAPDAKHGEQIMLENAEMATKRASDSGKVGKKYDIFLSHSSLDKTLVLTLVGLFNEADYSVYVDWIEDPQLDRSKVNKNTAQVLRNRMLSSKGLAYVATSNASNSKWCQWELGYFDGNKNSRCCILPIMDSEVFRGQEYLGLYPYIEYETSAKTRKYNFWIFEQETNNYVILRDWLKGRNPYQH